MADKKPNIKDQNKEGKLTTKLQEFLELLRKSTERDGDNRTAWKRKLVTANNQRLGVKRLTNRPYPGAPNIPLPEADKLISKKKPQFVLAAVAQKKKTLVRIAEGAQETPEKKAKAHKAELGMNFILNNKIDLIEKLTMAADNAFEKGHCIVKVIEKFSDDKIHKVIDLDEFGDDIIKQLRRMKNAQLSEVIAERFELDITDEDDKAIIDELISQFRRGKKILEVDIPVIESFPDILVRPPEKVTPPSYALDIETVERLRDEYFLTRRELEEGAMQGVYDKTVIDRLSELDFTGKGKSTSEDELIDSSKEVNEGVVEENEDELFRVQEIYTWYKPEGSDRYERWVFTFLADIGAVEDALIQKIRFPYEFNHWNYAKYDNELKDKRWHASRGIPEKIRALQEFSEKSINNMLIRDEINNTPTYTVLSNSLIQSGSIRFIPGQKIKVNSHNEINRLDDQQTVDISSERIAQLLKAYTEEYMGSSDQLFRNATNKGGGKTLGEIKAGIAQTTVQSQLEVIRWFMFLKKIYTMLFKLMRERLGQSIFVEGVEITREDFDFEAEVIPNGSIDLADENIRTQKAMNRVMLAMQLPPDIVNAEDRYNAVKDFYEADGVRDPDRYITQPQIIFQQQKQQMMAEDQVLAQQEQDLSNEIRQTQSRALAEKETDARTGTQTSQQSQTTPAR